MSERRDELLQKSLDRFLQSGVAGLSLRPLAEDIGTSARLLIYHFGSKEGLITAVMEQVRARVQASFHQVMSNRKREKGTGVMASLWAWMTDAANLPCLRLLLEVQVLALQDPETYAAYLEGGSSSWLDLIEAGLPPSPDRRAVATLCAAVMDGLFIEYLSTGDLRRTTAALATFDGVMRRSRPAEAPTSPACSSRKARP